MIVLFFLGFFITAALSETAEAGEDWIFLVIGLAVLWLILTAALFVPNAAVISRRMQDLDMPGAFGWGMYIGSFLFSFVGLVILVFMAFEGKKGDNQFGQDPKMNENVAEIFD